MNNKKIASIAIATYATFQILAGVIGSIIILQESFKVWNQPSSGTPPVFFVIIFVLFLWNIPPILAIFSGIFIMRRRWWSVFLNSFAWLAVAILYTLGICYSHYICGASMTNQRQPLLIISVTGAVFLFNIFLFTRPKIKEQFK